MSTLVSAPEITLVAEAQYSENEKNELLKENWHEAHDKGVFFDIQNPEHQAQFIKHISDGKLGAIDCIEPFGLMVGVKVVDNPTAADVVDSQKQVQKLGEAKGRDMSDQPAPFFCPLEYLEDVVDFEAMAAAGRWETDEVAKAISTVLHETGSFLAVPLKPPFTECIPYTKTITLGGREVKTGVVACVDYSFPALGDIVREVWRQGRVTLITSANLTHQDTLVDAQEVHESFPNIPLVDAPELKKQLNAMPVKQVSFTLSQQNPQNPRRIESIRQGNVAMDWWKAILEEQLPGVEVGVASKVKKLVETPYFGYTQLPQGEEKPLPKDFDLEHFGPAVHDRLLPYTTTRGPVREQRINGDINELYTSAFINRAKHEELMRLPFEARGIAARRIYKDYHRQELAKWQKAQEVNKALDGVEDPRKIREIVGEHYPDKRFISSNNKGYSEEGLIPQKK